MSAQDTTRSAGQAADRAGNSDALENLARVGLIASGVVHLLIAWLALQLAFGGGSGGSADQPGALATVAASPLGQPLLWLLPVRLAALALWPAAQIPPRPRGLSASGEARKKAVTKTVKSVAKTIVYLALAVLAVRAATGGGQSGSGQQQQQAAGVFGWPGGRWLVGAVGLVVIGVGVYLVAKGLRKKFLEEVDLTSASARTRALVEKLGLVGYPAKGVALAVVGALLTWAAITFDPTKATGLDGALRTILDAPFGRVLLTLVALGIAAFGAYCFVRARYPERT